jgi:hypothetical protein
LGILILVSGVLPRVFGWLAIFLGLSFSVLGILFLFQLVLPMAVTALAGTQVFWWLAACFSLIRKSVKTK